MDKRYLLLAFLVVEMATATAEAAPASSLRVRFKQGFRNQTVTFHTNKGRHSFEHRGLLRRYRRAIISPEGHGFTVHNHHARITNSAGKGQITMKIQSLKLTLRLHLGLKGLQRLDIVDALTHVVQDSASHLELPDVEIETEGMRIDFDFVSEKNHPKAKRRKPYLEGSFKLLGFEKLEDRLL